MIKQFLRTFLLLTFIFLVGCSKDDDPQNTPNPIPSNRLSTGDSAADFLSDELFSSLVIEVVYVEGYQPSQQSLDNLVSFINTRCHKSGGVELNMRSIAEPGDGDYDIQEIDDIEQDIRSQFNTENRLALFAMFINGKWHEDTDNSVVLGVAYRNTSFVIFEETLQRFSDQATEPDRVVMETTVFNHEFGHLLGLVDLGTDMQSDHLDTENGHHCDVEDCLMNYRVEAGISIGNISGGDVPQLDSQCIADLQANGGK
ncbi:membrane metalloprotease [Galbibacter sp. EGI 63066]|uniref:membrane metalloprotease n=1 Tax=Galbibacter sp. EGI 63066 TaxID=2993559 RepID=UPI002248FCE5|nr:membrane metalloprotease [Galbibacter sp. EGI 63066]MCX2679635.1 membrane metalloprotease [Galbibacter sp. EGI 63066]